MDLFRSIQNNDYKYGFSWDDIRESLLFLNEEEKYLIYLIRFGKSISDITEILSLNSKQTVYKKIKKTLDVLKFYVSNMDLIKKFYTNTFGLTRKEMLILRMYVLDRKTINDIKDEMDFSSFQMVSRAIKKIKKKIVDLEDGKLYGLIDDCVKKKFIRRKGKIKNMDLWRNEVYNFLLKNIGKIWYVWGGQNLNKKEADCSGLVIEVYKKFNILPETFVDATAQGLFDMFVFTPKHEEPKPGDLVFYGKDESHISHVMVYMGDVGGLSGGDYVVGMCGGRRGMTKKIAKLVGAGLWIRKLKYRNDYIGFLSI